MAKKKKPQLEDGSLEEENKNLKEQIMLRDLKNSLRSEKEFRYRLLAVIERAALALEKSLENGEESSEDDDEDDEEEEDEE